MATVNQRDVQKRYGSLTEPFPGTEKPYRGRLPAEDANLVGRCLRTAYPALTHSASKLLAQHFLKSSTAAPDLSIQHALLSIGEDFGLEPKTFKGPESLVEVVENDEPVASFLSEVKRVVHLEKQERREKEERVEEIQHEVMGDIEEDLSQGVSDMTVADGAAVAEHVAQQLVAPQDAEAAAAIHDAAAAAAEEAAIQEAAKQVARREETLEAVAPQRAAAGGKNAFSQPAKKHPKARRIQAAVAKAAGAVSSARGGQKGVAKQQHAAAAAEPDHRVSSSLYQAFSSK